MPLRGVAFDRPGGQAQIAGWDSLKDEDSDEWSDPPEMFVRLQADAAVRQFRCQPDADPIGVMWLGYMGGDSGLNRTRQEAASRRSVVAPEHEHVLESMINAAASMIAILKFRGFDRNGVMRPVE